ncbi:RHS repeat-associated core domain-containing protein [Pseudomonas sp. PB101]|jgi:insecticidal toxin complex protein TccC|uniref:RHS repeat-associated core domain-containing protein n=1 Tax=Pseudomonas sp. PB101 TaxID=2495428 RepID=UPI002114F7FD|nr:RHS repeat-associated core domain-containing protein [Pseudomonas sp. PB101]
MSLNNVHRDTPSLAVADPRGLAVRAIQYHRRQAADPVELRVTHQRFDGAGRPVASRDPYLFALAQDDASVPANLSQVFSLSGVPLASDSVDAGWRAALQGAAGQRIEVWDGRGSHSLTEFDELLRPVAVHERGEDVAEHVLERFSYAGVDGDAVSHNLCGQLIRHDDPAGTLHLRELGIAGALLQQTRYFLLGTDPANWPDSVTARDALLEPGEGATTSHAYAPTTELLQQLDALGNSQRFTYTVAGEQKDSRLTLAGDEPREQKLVSDLYYNASGQIESETAGNGVITRHRYDPADGRLIALSAHKANGTPLQNLKYSYDAAGNVQSLEDTAQPIRYFNNQRIEPIKNYCYDTLYQLIKATGWEARTGHGGPALPDLQPLPLDPNQVAQYTQTFHYDAGGNLLDLVHVGAQAHGRTLTRARYSNRCLPERNGRPPTEAELAAGFDGNGNLSELQAGQAMDWDLRNQLSTVRPVVREGGNDDYETYLYDGGGQRVRKLRATQTNARKLISEVRYLPGVEIRSHSGTGEILHVITASAGSNSVQVLHWAAKPPGDITNDQVRYSLNDHLKSSAMELDQNADLISQEWYYPFGGTACFAARSATEAKYKTVRYSGKERDATGLYYYGFRYYAPWLQRWINPDPAGSVDGHNLFSMVRNNTVTYFDASGNIRENFNFNEYLSSFQAIMHYSPNGIFYIDEGEQEEERGNQYFLELLSLESIDTESSQHSFQQRLRAFISLIAHPQRIDQAPEVPQEQIDSYGIFYNYMVAASTFEDIPRIFNSPFGLREAPPSYWHALDENAGPPGIPSAPPPAYAMVAANLPTYSTIDPIAVTAADDREAVEDHLSRSVLTYVYIPIPTYQQATAFTATEPRDGQASLIRRRERRSTV